LSAETNASSLYGALFIGTKLGDAWTAIFTRAALVMPGFGASDGE